MQRAQECLSESAWMDVYTFVRPQLMWFFVGILIANDYTFRNVMQPAETEISRDEIRNERNSNLFRAAAAG